MEDSIYNLQTSTLKTKDLEHSGPLRKCSGQGRTNDVTAPNCSGNPASKSTRRGHRRLDFVPAAITNLPNELKLSWPKIARQLGVSGVSVRTVRGCTRKPRAPISRLKPSTSLPQKPGAWNRASADADGLTQTSTPR